MSHLALLGAGLSGPGTADPLLTDLVAWWRADESSGNLLDAHTNALHLTDNNTVGATTGKVGGARSFAAASSEFFNRADTALLRFGDTNFYIAAWVKLATVGANRGIVAKYHGVTTTKREFILFYLHSSQRFVLSLRNDTLTLNANTFGALSLDTWYFVEAWHDATNNVAGIAVNGVEDTSAWTDGTYADDCQFCVGAYGTAGGEGGHMNGMIDEIVFLRRIPTSEERTRLHNSGNGMTYPA